MLTFGNNWYYLPILLQGFCVWHSFNRGTTQKWLWVIIILPVIGSAIYIYQEILSNRRVAVPKLNVGAIVNPGGAIKKLEEQLKFTDTFNNRIQLADAYLAAGYTDKAIDLYTASLTGAFAENEHVIEQLMVAYNQQEEYEKVIPLAQKIYKTPQFACSKAHVVYAMALEANGQLEQAEAEFKSIKGRYSNFEQRYQYGLFLVRQERYEDAEKMLTEMLDEQPHLSAVEKRSNRQWFGKAKEELKKLNSISY
ncbi:MAG: tetratricopeptide repeat protein [Mucilaginibacter sp.]|nr:tetratricopeptide repeat protein [Mucilaginibacter sp.]